MKDAGQYLLAAIAAAIVAHFAVIVATPRMMMSAAIHRIDPANAWRHAPRASEDTRDIVRPSPDLAASACAFDLSHGPVHIVVAAWNDYMSLSLYGANSDNFFVLSDREAPRGIDLVLIKHGARAPEHVNRVVESPSTRGIVLVRRLAPNAERFAAADAARQHDVCAPFHAE